MKSKSFFYLNQLQRWSIASLLVLLSACGTPSSHVGPTDGVRVGDGSSLKGMVPASQLEASATKQYSAMKQKAAQKNALAHRLSAGRAGRGAA